MGSTLLVLLVIGAGWLLLRERDSTPSQPVLPLVPLVQKGDRVWLLGDSLAVGLTSRLRALANVKGVILSTTTKVGAATMWGSIQAQGPVAGDHDVWIVCLGANDAALPVPSTNFRKWVRTVLEQASARSADVVWLIPPDGGGLPGYAKVFEIVADEVPDTLQAPAGLHFAKDGVHLTPDGYQQWADAIWSAITSPREA